MQLDLEDRYFALIVDIVEIRTLSLAETGTRLRNYFL